jgi:hypothetical protein
MQESCKKIYCKLWKTNCLAIIFTFLIPLTALSQKEELHQDTIHETIDTSLNYLDPWEYVFMMHEETKWIFKGFLNERAGRTYGIVGFETKLTSSFTINIEGGSDGYVYNLPDNKNLFYEDANYLSMDFRWYYRQKKRINDKNLPSNLSDNYISLGYRYSRSFSNDLINSHQLFAKWGMQRRFLNNGIVDVGFELHTQINADNPLSQLRNYANIGLAYAKDRYQLNKGKLCPVLRCYAADNYIFKTNLSELIYMISSKDEFRMVISPELAFEKKLGRSPFSINTGIEARLGYSISSNSYTNFSYSVSALLEGRWYYNLKRRMRKGKTGNGLSANYIAFGGLIGYGESYSIENFDKVLYFVTGWQRLFGEHLYYDINLGLSYFMYRNKNNYIDPTFKIGVGYRF